MGYYLVDVSKSAHGIAYLTDAKYAVIESLDEDLYDARIKVHLVDYKQCRDSVTTFGSPSKQAKTWKIEKELNSLPSAHRFKVGDKVFLKKEPPPSDISNVYDAVYFNSEHEPITVSLLHYYEWNHKTYAVVGFSDSYGGWAPEDLLEHYTTTRPDPERDKGGFKVGEQVLVNVYQGCGIPYPLDRDETVTIVDDSYSSIAVGSDHWTHVVQWNNKYLRLDYVRGKFRRIPQEPNPCKEVPLPATNCVSYSGNISHGTTTSTGTVVTTDIYPGYESYFRDVLISEEPIPEKETKIQILKLQQPIILKSKKHKSWK